MATISKRNWFRGLIAALILTFSGLAFAACGSEEHSKEGIVEGEPVALGSLKYNVLFTRPLNPHDVEDAEYLVGKQPAPVGKSWIGVFLKVHNLSKTTAYAIPKNFKIETTAGRQYANHASESVYALQPGSEVPPLGDLPEIDSTPQVGPIQASMLLYLVDDESLEERPIVQIIEGEHGPATVELDL